MKLVYHECIDIFFLFTPDNIAATNQNLWIYLSLGYVTDSSSTRVNFLRHRQLKFINLLILII